MTDLSLMDNKQYAINSLCHEILGGWVDKDTLVYSKKLHNDEIDVGIKYDEWDTN